MKKIYLRILALLLTLTGCGADERYDVKIVIPAGSQEEFVYSDEESDKVDNENEKWARIPMIMVDGELYLTTGFKSTTEGRCGVMDVKIEFTEKIMMNEVIRQLTERKSVRVFEDRTISEEEKTAILRAAMEAPTAGNQQLYTILDITDQQLKEQLAETCDHQPFIAKAPLVLVFCADCCKWLDAYKEAGCSPRKPGAGDLMLAVTDTAIAAQNAVTAAWSLGIGSCYIGDVMEQCETHRKILNLPEYVFPAAMLVFGYPTEQQKLRTKPERFALKDIVSENTYHRKSGEELRVMFEKDCRNQGYDEWVEKFCNRKYNSDFSKEMTRSVEMYLQDYEL